MYLGLDPGETTGWALHGLQGIPMVSKSEGVQMGQVGGLEALVALLEAFRPIPEVIIFERYVIRDLDRDINYGELETIQAIGVIKSYAYRNKIELVGQLRTVKKQGYGWSPMVNSPGAKPVSHKRDAHAHVMYYLVKNNLMPIRRRAVK